MPTTTTNYPNGQQLASTALTQRDMNALVQSLTCGMLGVIPVDFSAVRVDWQAEGQPDVARPSQDACYVSCVTQDTEYSRVRDRVWEGDSSAPVLETWTYTRGWRVEWALYGPNCVDRARQIHSAMFMDYFNDQFAASNLYPVADFQEPTRAPETHNAQWYDSARFSCAFYEQVTETISTPSVTSVEVKVYDGDPNDPVADIHVPPST